MSEIRERLQARLVELRGERDRIDAVLAELAALLEAEPESEVPKNGKPPGKVRAPVAAGANGKSHGKAHGRRLAIARLLAERGPLPAPDILKQLDIPLGSKGNLFPHEWFEKASPEKGSPYQLTEKGRSAAGAASSTP